MSESAVEHFFAGIPVMNYQRAVTWYTALFGRQPDVIVSENREAMWQVAEKAWVYIVLDSQRAGNALVTMLVSDLDAQLVALSDRGIKVRDVETVPGLYRKATFTDPDSNSVAYGQNLQAAE